MGPLVLHKRNPGSVKHQVLASVSFLTAENQFLEKPEQEALGSLCPWAPAAGREDVAQCSPWCTCPTHIRSPGRRVLGLPARSGGSKHLLGARVPGSLAWPGFGSHHHSRCSSLRVSASWSAHCQRRAIEISPPIQAARWCHLYAQRHLLRVHSGLGPCAMNALFAFAT